MLPYSSYYPASYQQYPQTNYQAQTAQQPNNGFISVRNELEARNYPIAPGNSVTFIDESQPFCYTKTMGFNQLDRPIFKRYRLVEETEQPTVPIPQPAANTDTEETKARIEALESKYEDIVKKLERLNDRNKQNSFNNKLTKEDKSNG